VIVLDSTTPKYAYFDATVAPQTASAIDYLPSLGGFPWWMILDFNVADVAANTFLCSLSRNSGASRYALQLQASTLQLNNAAAGLAAFAGVTALAWHRAMIYSESRTATYLLVDGVSTVVDATDNPWPLGIDTLAFNARIESANPADLHRNVAFANHAIGHTKLTSAERLAASILGVNPQSVRGCCVNYQFRTDALEISGDKPLTLVGAPSIVTTHATYGNHPEVAAFPPSGGSDVIYPIKGVSRVVGV
jgi:hypothetical protein